MKTTTRHLAAALALACIAPACGPSYNFISMEDHPTKELTIIDVEATRPIVPLVLYSTSREFWMCTESGASLDCQRACKPIMETSTKDMNDLDLVLCPNAGEGIQINSTKNPNLNVTGANEAPTRDVSPPPVEDVPPPAPDEATP